MTEAPPVADGALHLTSTLLDPGSVALMVGLPGMVTGEPVTDALAIESPAGLVAATVML